MRRVLRRAVGVLVAASALGLVRPAPAQVSSYQLRGARTPVRKVQYEESSTLTEGHSRLEEMKVELAWLADVGTFSYYLGARASNGNLEVRGYVPNDMVKQRALELARQHTFLNVVDRLSLHTGLAMRPPLRRAELLQKEGAELLVKNLGEGGRLFHLQVHSNGRVTVTGSVGSVEEKVEISRLFRQLGGCSGVVNRLHVAPVLHDGQKVVLVTRDGSQVVPPSALPSEPGEIVPSTPPAAPVVPAPEPRLMPTPITSPTPPAPPKVEQAPEQDRKPSMLPSPQRVLPLPPVKPTPHTLDAQDTELRLPKPPSGPPLGAKPASPEGKATEPPVKPVKARTGDSSWSSDALTPPSLAPKGATSDKPKPPAVVSPKPAPPAIMPRTPQAAPLPGRAVRQWPPAYDKGPPPGGPGRPGVIIFEDDPPPAPAPATPPSKPAAPPSKPAAPPISPVKLSTAPARPIVPADLKRQVQTACGGLAREVDVVVQPDRSLLVKVRVSSIAAEKQVIGKVLALPGMTAPGVRLRVDVK